MAGCRVDPAGAYKRSTNPFKLLPPTAKSFHVRERGEKIQNQVQTICCKSWTILKVPFYLFLARNGNAVQSGQNDLFQHYTGNKDGKICAQNEMFVDCYEVWSLWKNTCALL
ncbi:hypothetical protein XENORESO_002779 [Xenotaenia resolanae]|uniref:Uncharacterized protein n=1 Tax=Xenotaenia resolanae TaxID=208358 RepID=A0ABV0VLC3_9TELE